MELGRQLRETSSHAVGHRRSSVGTEGTARAWVTAESFDGDSPLVVRTVWTLPVDDSSGAVGDL